MLTIYTDGSCVQPSDTPGTDPDTWQRLTNGARAGHGGWAWWISDGLHDAGAVETTTSLRMEVQAVIEALRSPHITEAQPLTMATDCHEIVKVMTRAAATGYTGWPWLPTSRSPLEDLTYWETLADLATIHPAPIHWTKIKGHSGIEGNQQADRLARAQARHLARDLASGTPNALTR